MTLLIALSFGFWFPGVGLYCAWRFRAMNPENGWGDYDSFRDVLVEMCRAVPEWPTTWGVWG